MKKSDVSVKMVQHGKQRRLIISGERKEPELPQLPGVRVYRERARCDKFVREFTVDSDVDAQKISAKHEDGILTVTVPRAPQPVPEEVAVAIQ